MNGIRLSADLEASVQEVVVHEVLNDISSFKISISDPDGKWLDHRDISMGSKITVLMGYKDMVIEMLSGEITSINAYFGKSIKADIVLTGSDFLHKCDRGYKVQAFNNKSGSDILNKIANDGGGNIFANGVSTVKPFHLQKEVTDIQVMRNFAECAGAGFITRLGKVSFSPLSNMSSLIPVILEYGKTLLEFESFKESRGLNCSVDYRGWNCKDYTLIQKNLGPSNLTTKIGGSTAGSEKTSNAFGTYESVKTDFTVKDESETETRAETFLNTESMEYLYARGKCQGNIALHGGNTIIIKEVGDDYSGSYIVLSAKHRLVPMKGYTVEFEAARNCI